MTNAPSGRKTHVIRILGTNRNGDIVPDIWLDVERMDEAKSVFQDDLTTFQGTVKKLKWQDDPDGDDFSEDGPASRKIRIVKVCSPDETNQDDPEQWIPIQAIDKMRSSIADQNKVGFFLNGDDHRVVEVRRILHYDTSIDNDAQSAFNADPTRKVYVVAGDLYSRNDDTKDDSQWLEHEIVTFLKSQSSGQTKAGNGDDQGKQTKLLNQYLIDESEPAQGDVIGPNGFNPPWRLDPYQNIINVQLGGATQYDISGDVTESNISGMPGSGAVTTMTLSAAIKPILDPVIKSSPFTGDAGLPSLGPVFGGNTIGVFRFDYPASDTPGIAFGVQYQTNGTVTVYAMTNGEVDIPNGLLNEFGPDAGTPVDPITKQVYVVAQAAVPSYSFTDDEEYHHIMVAIDTSGVSSATIDPDHDFSGGGLFASGVTVIIAIDGVVYPVQFPNFATTFPDNQGWANAFGGGQWPTRYDSSWVPEGESAVSYIPFVDLPAITMDVGACNAVAGNWPFDNTSSAIAALQVWPGQFIDPNSAIGDFFVSGGLNTPLVLIAPSVTQERHGIPYIYCDGAPGSFMKNRGTGPNFTQKSGYIQTYPKKPKFG